MLSSVKKVEKAKKEYMCDKCKRSFDRKANFVRHFRVHQSKVEIVVCCVCSKTYANKANLKQHFIDCHPEFKLLTPQTKTVSNRSTIHWIIDYYCYYVHC